MRKLEITDLRCRREDHPHQYARGFNLDGVKRDCLPWAMDAVLSSIGMNCVFGDDGTPRMFRNRIEQQTALYMSRSRAIPCAPICWAWSGPRHASP